MFVLILILFQVSNVSMKAYPTSFNSVQECRIEGQSAINNAIEKKEYKSVLFECVSIMEKSLG